ncbi:MAG: glycosyltransferase family 4 protein [Methyloceanibacter sp.]|uniref:glycosyltransferase family 4 protein n=1 Tax=Methyloceanibacter sp. TaxID=1965321 RepID=UPI003D6CC367
MAPRLLYVVTEDWYFLSHRLPMARAAKAAGYEIHVATRIKDAGAAIAKEGFTPHALSWSRGSLSLGDSLSAIRELRGLFRSLGPALVHNVSLKPVVLGSAASLGLPPVVVNSLTGVGSLFIGEARVSGLARRAVRFALGSLLRRDKSWTVVQNPDDRAFVLELGVPPEHVVTIRGSGVDTERLVPLPEPPPPITAAYVGRMLADKGVMTLIDAFALLAKRGVAMRLLLAGDTDKENPGSLAPEQLREFASAFGIQWLGHVADIREVWRQAHFAVLASRREGLPKSLLEAAACGRAMVATDAPGCREIAIAGETALTVPVDDIEALADAMGRMAEDARLRERFGKAARRLVEAEFSAEAIGRQTVALYDRLTGR